MLIEEPVSHYSVVRVFTVVKNYSHQMLRYMGSLWPQRAARQFLTLQEGKPPAILFAAIANPVPQYSGTRHNVGNWALEEVLKNRTDIPPFKLALKYRGFQVSECASLNCVFLLSTLSFMNLQGRPIAKAWQQFQKEYAGHSTALVIIHDEIEIAPGRVTVRKQNTSARGHNGLRSIDKTVGPGYTKIGVGIGKSDRLSVDKHVLSKFTSDELELLTEKSLPQVDTIISEMLQGKYIYEKQ